MKGNTEIIIRDHGCNIVDNMCIESTQFIRDFGTLDKFKHTSNKMKEVFEMLYYCNIKHLIIKDDNVITLVDNKVYIIDAEDAGYMFRVYWLDNRETNLLMFDKEKHEMELDYIHANAIKLLLNMCNKRSVKVEEYKRQSSEISDLEYMMGCIKCDDGTFIEI